MGAIPTDTQNMKLYIWRGVPGETGWRCPPNGAIRTDV